MINTIASSLLTKELLQAEIPFGLLITMSVLFAVSLFFTLKLVLKSNSKWTQSYIESIISEMDRNNKSVVDSLKESNGLILKEFEKNNVRMFGAIERIAGITGTKLVEDDTAVDLIRYIIELHIIKKVDIVREILNESRTLGINETLFMEKVACRFDSVVLETKNFLSRFNTGKGRLSTIMDNSIDYDTVASRTVAVMISDNSIDEKCKCVATLMNEYLNAMLKVFSTK